jgi:hypothetical protein
MLWGLASLSLTPEGRESIAQVAGSDIAASDGFVSRESVTTALKIIMENDGVERTLEVIRQLAQLGFQASVNSGASISPFIGGKLRFPPEPSTDDPDAWQEYVDICTDIIASLDNYEDADLGPQLLAVKCGARGSLRQLTSLIGSQEAVNDFTGSPVIVRHGYNNGFTPTELYAKAAGAREGLSRIAIDCMDAGYGIRERYRSKGFTVLARAVRSAQPGPVFARAAASGEVDPLADIDSRLFVGLPVR